MHCQTASLLCATTRECLVGTLRGLVRARRSNDPVKAGVRALAASLVLLLPLAVQSPRARADSTPQPQSDPPSTTGWGVDEVSYFGERVYSLRQWPPSTAWGISFREILAPYFAASLAYLNDGHFPGHHRDGVALEGWVPFWSFYHQVSLSAGIGPFYYYDTVLARNTGGYADAHAWTWLASLQATYQPVSSGSWSHLFFTGRLDYASPAKSIETLSIGGGIGYRGFSDTRAGTSPEPPAPNELVVSYWKTVVNSFSSQTSRAEAIDYRRQIWGPLGASIGFLNEGDARLIRRNGLIAEGWAEPTFSGGLWSIGAGFGVYSAIDKYRAAPGRHFSDIVSATVSFRPVDHLDIRFLWHRIVTDYNRDTDVVLWGLGYRW